MHLCLELSFKRAQPREWHRFGRSRKKSLWKGVPYERLCLKNGPNPFLELSSPIPGIFCRFFLGIFEIFENFRYFFGPLKVPIEKSFRGVFNWKNSKFSPRINSWASCWVKSDFGQNRRFAVFDFFDGQPIKHASRFWRQIDGLNVLHPHSEFRLRVTLGKKVTAKNVISLLGEHHFY